MTNEISKTKIWIDGQKKNAVTVNYEVRDLDQSAKLLGFANYIDLRMQCESVDTVDDLDDDDDFLNFEYN